MLLCNYCGDEISPDSHVNVYVRDDDIRYVTHRETIPTGFECVDLCIKGERITYLRHGSKLPAGFTYVSVFAKDQDIIYRKEGDDTPTGFECVRANVKTDCILYARDGNTSTSFTKDLRAKEILHKDCLLDHIPRCEEAVTKFIQCASSTDRILPLGIHVKYLYGVGRGEDNKKKKREKRDRKLHQLLEKVSALRNSNSGYILVHLVGLAPGDSFTGAFDEFADTKLHGLIHDGQLFTDVYRKEKLSGHRVLCDFDDFLALYVSASSILTTSEFNTKITLDDCIVDIPADTLRTFIRKRGEFEGTFATLPTEIQTVNDVVRVHESRSIQMKSHFLQKKGNHDIVT
ncbi:uncharacterized protein [Haliotis cracherodii]|uniref:uncharacterized protein n=1 Tax=Haliotis cracherodii TaxID=6455 RepID=UPI0039EB7E84